MPPLLALIVLQHAWLLNMQLIPKFGTYHKISNIRCILVCYEIVDHSDGVGASPVGAAPTTSSLLTEHLASVDWAKATARRDEKHLSVRI